MLALIISKFTVLSVGNVYLIMYLFVLFLSLSYLSLTDIFWSVFAVVISGRIINYIYYQEDETLCQTEGEMDEEDLEMD